MAGDRSPWPCEKATAAPAKPTARPRRPCQNDYSGAGSAAIRSARIAAQIRRLGARLSRAQDVVGRVAVPGHSPAGQSAGPHFYTSAPMSGTHYSAAMRYVRTAARPTHRPPRADTSNPHAGRTMTASAAALHTDGRDGTRRRCSSWPVSPAAGSSAPAASAARSGDLRKP
jgi:hypothetical protein